MAKTNLEGGDIVQLKSGGPEMTITKIDTKIPKLGNRPIEEREFNTVHAKWFEGEKLEFGKFLEHELKFIRKETDGFFQ
jgi:uncharacterized protein YodC (DUF2158 family)